MRESKNFCAIFLTKFLINLDGIWYSFYLVRSVFKQENYCTSVISFLFLLEKGGGWGGREIERKL